VDRRRWSLKAACASPILRWHNNGVPGFNPGTPPFDQSPVPIEKSVRLDTIDVRRRLGRRAVAADVRALIRSTSETNPLWGAPRTSTGPVRPARLIQLLLFDVERIDPLVALRTD